MALARYGREKEYTIGEGDCAFNAFTLALCQPVVLSQIERSIKSANQDINIRFQDFILNAAETLGTDVSWDAVKTALLRLRKNRHEELQRHIAPIMRQLSIDIARNSTDAILLKARTVDKLGSVFNDYLRKKRNKPVTSPDDIFSRHGFITNKFYEVYSGKDKDKLTQRKKIENWWWNAGYDQFLNEMAKPKVWAGDIELARLAKYFNVVLNIIPDEGFLYNIYGDYGYFPFLGDEMGKNIPKVDRAEVVEHLRNRFVLAQGYEDVHQYGVNFAMPNFADVSRRLHAVPNHEEVSKFIIEQAKLKGQIVPSKWPKRCLEELIQRNVIGRASDSKSYSFSVDGNVALQLIAEVPHYREVLQICRKHYKSHSTLVLHKSPNHWSNTIHPEEQRQFEAHEKMMHRLSQGFFNTRSINAIPLSVASYAVCMSLDSVVHKKT